MELLPETLDDLWHLSHIVEVGDIISSKTTRRIQDNSGDKLRSDRGVKKTFFLEIEVENIGFHIFTGKLRLTGTIIKGPEDLIPLGSHHTVEVKLNTPIIIKKEKWSRYILKRVNQAIEASKKLSAIIIVFEDDVATIGLIRQFGVEYYGPIHGSISGKMMMDKNRNKNINKFYQSVVEAISKFSDVKSIVLAGPGFVKNDFFKFLKEKYKNLAKKSIVENIGTGGRVGIQEVIRKGIIEELTVENRISSEIIAVNELMETIAKDSSKVAYGNEETTNAVNMGAVKRLLVLDKLVAQNDYNSIMEMVENMNGEVMVISCEHEGGERLGGLGGIAATLRYPIA